MPMLAELIDAVVGVDTHRDTHEVEIALPTGTTIGTRKISNDSSGFAELLAWIGDRAPGPRVAVSIEGTRSFGVGVARAVAAAGDIVVNNAGIGSTGSVADHTDDDWRRVFDVNVLGIARVSRAALPHLKRSRAAAIVNVSSVVAVVGVPQRAIYAASKGAVSALTLAMAADHVRDGIRVNAVTPGTADTPWVARLLSAAPDADVAAANLKARQPMGRLVTADEIAHSIAYLASPRSASTTGTLLGVDGGMSGIRVG